MFEDISRFDAENPIVRNRYQKKQSDSDFIKSFVPSKNETKKNNIPAAAGHFLSTEVDSTDLKNGNLTTKIKRNKAE